MSREFVTYAKQPASQIIIPVNYQAMRHYTPPSGMYPEYGQGGVNPNYGQRQGGRGDSNCMQGPQCLLNRNTQPFVPNYGHRVTYI